tara:strand:+ start:367 stop:525 length:159 start_codon:yes stop_codon:yes gene_type:complete
MTTSGATGGPMRHARPEAQQGSQQGSVQLVGAELHDLLKRDSSSKAQVQRVL